MRTLECQPDLKLGDRRSQTLIGQIGIIPSRAASHGCLTRPQDYKIVTSVQRSLSISKTLLKQYEGYIHGGVAPWRLKRVG